MPPTAEINVGWPFIAVLRAHQGKIVKMKLPAKIAAGFKKERRARHPQIARKTVMIGAA
ncbi:MAG: hypothetical protein ALAOOOJD_04318 [bacterium]|nr:hypothetical protein [bacterium]